MNLELQKLFQGWYTPKTLDGAPNAIDLTNTVRPRIIEVFKKHNIESIFDAGCNNCIWMNELLNNNNIKYQGGDISPEMIDYVQKTFPDLVVQVHDVTTDTFPCVDLLFVRDVAIHLNNNDKYQLWKNWLSSNIPWILITHNKENTSNINLEYVESKYRDRLQTAETNWELAPWRFPEPIDQAWEYDPGGRCMALWHRTQIENIL